MEEEDQSSPKEESRVKKIVKIVFHALFHVIFICYFIWATVIYILFDRRSIHCVPQTFKLPDYNITEVNDTDSTEPPKFEKHLLCDINWCHGYGFLVVLFTFFYIVWIYYWVFKPLIGKRLYNNHIEPLVDRWMLFSRKLVMSLVLLAIVILLVCAFLAYECHQNARKLIGVSAPVVFVLLGVAMSKDRKKIQWRVVVHGLVGQLILGLICIRWEFGRNIFECAGEKITRFLHFAEYGARFAYGDRICNEFVFAFAILAVIFFFSVVTSCLYFLGAMQFILSTLGFLLQATVGTTVCESVNAIGNIFLGMTESPLMIRPYIAVLTLSEMHTICVSGYSTVAGTVLGAYISFGASPAYLITASVMAAPGALAFSKLFYPETEESKTKSDNIQLEKSPDNSLLDAAASGAANGVMIVLGIVSNIIAFLGVIYFFNAVIEWLFALTGHNGITFIYLLTKIFTPVVFLMGVLYEDCEKVALVVAEKTVINEFIGYKHLGEMIHAKEIDHRSAGIATFALCGFANPGSLGIMIAALSVMAPNRKSDITKVALRAFLVGSIVSFTSASIAGILIQEADLEQIGSRVQQLRDDYERLKLGQYLFDI